MSRRSLEELDALLHRVFSVPVEWESPDGPWKCWRCFAEQERGWESMCAPCLAWMSGESDIDPLERTMWSNRIPGPTQTPNHVSNIAERERRFQPESGALRRWLDSIGLSR